MADADVAQVFQNLAVEMSNVSMALGAQGINHIITPYEGDPKNLRKGLSPLKNMQLLRTWGIMIGSNRLHTKQVGGLLVGTKLLGNSFKGI